MSNGLFAGFGFLNVRIYCFSVIYDKKIKCLWVLDCRINLKTLIVISQ